MKLLNLTPADRVNCSVIYNVNRFEVYHADGWMMTAAQTAGDLNKQLLDNGIESVKYDRVATSKISNIFM